MSGDFDKREWQEQQQAHDAAWDKQREQWAKQKERAARNARRKLERLQAKLEAAGDLSEWEAEFAESVTERLDTFGSAFQDPEKGRPADALSFAQKKVMAALNKKAKGVKSANAAYAAEDSEKPAPKRRSSFKSKRPYTPRVRQIDDDIPTEPEPPFIPEYAPEPAARPAKPFLRVVK